MGISHFGKRSAQLALVCGLSGALVFSGIGGGTALAFPLFEYFKSFDSLQTDLLVRTDTQHTHTVDFKASRTVSITQELDYSNLAKAYLLVDTALGQLPYSSSLFSDQAMPYWRQYLELIAAGKEGDIQSHLTDKPTHIRANLETRDPDWTKNDLNGITIDASGNSNVNGVTLPPVTRAKAMELAQSVLDQAGDDNAKLRELILESNKVGSETSSPNPMSGDIDTNSTLKLSFTVTQSIPKEDRPYLEIETPQANSLKDTSGGIFSLQNAQAKDTDNDGRKDTLTADIVYIGGANSQLDIYEQFLGFDALHEGGKQKENILSFDTPVSVSANAPEGTELSLHTSLTGTTTYWLYENNTADPKNATGKELQDFWLCYLSQDFLETAQGGSLTLSFAQSPDGKDSTLPDADTTISLTGKVVPKKELSVNVHFVDDATGAAIANPQKLALYEFDAYETQPLTIEGYMLVAMPENASGTLVSDDIEVTYRYQKIAQPEATPTPTETTTKPASIHKSELPKTSDITSVTAIGGTLGASVAAFALRKKLRK